MRRSCCARGGGEKSIGRAASRWLAAAGLSTLLACRAAPPADDPEGAALSLFLQARIARVNGDVERAVDLLERAAALQPSQGAIAAALGEGLLVLGEEAEARAPLERAAALSDDVGAQVLLARLDVRDRRPDAALVRLIALDERRPAQPAVLELLHPLLLWAGETQRGLEIFTRTLAVAPDLAFAQEACGDFQACLGRDEEALASYRRALALEPGRRAAELKAARILGQQVDQLLRRLPAPADPGLGLPAAPSSAPGSR